LRLRRHFLISFNYQRYARLFLSERIKPLSGKVALAALGIDHPCYIGSMGLCGECLRDQRACLLQLGSSSIMIGTQFDKTFLDPSFVFRGGLRNLTDFGVGVLLQLLHSR
jgi:hypothetical protein